MNKKIFFALVLLLVILIGYLLYLWLTNQAVIQKTSILSGADRKKIVIVSPGGIYAPLTAGFQASLAAKGWKENEKAVFLDIPFAGQGENLSATLAGLSTQKPDLILAVTTPAAVVVQNVFKDWPVIFAAVGDPLAAGLIKDYAHSSGHAAGCADGSDQLAEKRLEIAHEAFPSLRRLAIIWTAADKNSAAAVSRLQVVARIYDLEIFSVPVADEREYLFAAEALDAAVYDFVYLLPDELTILHWPRLASQARAIGLPVIGYEGGQAEKFASLAYGAAADDLGRQCADLAEKIMLGAPISESPSTMPEKFYLSVNLTAIKEANLSLAPSVLARVDKIFE